MSGGLPPPLMSQAEAKHHRAQAKGFMSALPRQSPDPTAGHGGLTAGIGGRQMHPLLPSHLLVVIPLYVALSGATASNVHILHVDNFHDSNIESFMILNTLQSQSSEVIWKSIENDVLPRIVPRIGEEEGRTCRDIGSAAHKEVGGRNGGQERSHSAEVLRKRRNFWSLGCRGNCGQLRREHRRANSLG